MQVIEVARYSEEVFENINALLPLLSSSARPIQERELRFIIEHPSVHLLLAQENENYLGTLTLAVFPIITGTRAWIEDVVVSESARGKGVGKMLTSEAIILAKKLGAKTVDLTSRPSRKAANELYKKAGFELRETNAYRFNV